MKSIQPRRVLARLPAWRRPPGRTSPPKPSPQVEVTGSADPDQGLVYAAFIAAALEAEHARRTSLEQRGARLQQLAPLTLGFFATAIGLVTGSVQSLGPWPLWLFIASTAALTTSVLFGIRATSFIAYDVADNDTMTKMLGEKWGDNPIDARNITADINRGTLDGIRKGNASRVRSLTWGTAMQVAGQVLGALAFVVAAAGPYLAVLMPCLGF